jgi:hypothetical protein
MKKFLLFILVFLYFGTSTGFTMHLHYCMDALVETNLLAEEDEDDCSATCEMPEESGEMEGCCDELQKQVKLDEVHKAAENAFLGMKNLAVSLPPSLFSISFQIDIPGIAQSNPTGNSLPDWRGVPHYLRNCVFLI